MNHFLIIFLHLLSLVMELDKIRREYNKGSLDEHAVQKDPFLQFKLWMEDALNFVKDEPTAMVLSTVDDNRPSSRIVLLKDFDLNGFTFFTNYESRKGKEMQNNSQVSLLFFWKELERQIRIEGKVEKTPPEISDEYFQGRPFESRVAASVSNQSREVKNREELDRAFSGFKSKVEVEKTSRPDFWGGYRLIPDYFEFWQGRENRMHDRIVYEPEGEKWKLKRLAP